MDGGFYGWINRYKMHNISYLIYALSVLVLAIYSFL